MIDLTYEKISQTYAEDLIDLWQDEEVIKYTNIKTPCTFEQIKDRISRFEQHDVFVIKDSDRVVGVIGCPCIDKDKAEYGIFYQLKKAEWGRQIATESTIWMLEYMKNKYSKLIIYADVVEDNIASDKILMKLGFNFISNDKEEFERDGHKMNVKKYRLVEN